MLNCGDNLAQPTPPKPWALDFCQAVEDVICNNTGPQLRRAVTCLVKHPRFRYDGRSFHGSDVYCWGGGK